jgi:hypothetical protein
MKEILECALIQGDRKGSPLLYTACGAAPFVYSRGGACPRPAALHFLYLSPAESAGGKREGCNSPDFALSTPQVHYVGRVLMFTTRIWRLG